MAEVSTSETGFTPPSTETQGDSSPSQPVEPPRHRSLYNKLVSLLPHSRPAKVKPVSIKLDRDEIKKNPQTEASAS